MISEIYTRTKICGFLIHRTREVRGGSIDMNIEKVYTIVYA